MCVVPFGFFCKLLGLDLSVVEVVLWRCQCSDKNVNGCVPEKNFNLFPIQDNHRFGSPCNISMFNLFLIQDHHLNQVGRSSSPCWSNSNTTNASPCFVFTVKPKEITWFKAKYRFLILFHWSHLPSYVNNVQMLVFINHQCFHRHCQRQLRS